MRSGNLENDRNAAYDSPSTCSSRSSVRPLCTWPSYSCSTSPGPHLLRRAADGGGSLSDPISVCRTSHATSRDLACRAASALAVSARPSRSACSVHFPISPAGTASSSMPSVRSAVR